MTPRLFARAFLVSALALAAAGCGDDDLVTTPTVPTPEFVTETFTGTLQRNGGVTHTFVTSSFGSIQAILVTLVWDAEAAPAIGLSLGTWNGTSCSAVIAQDRAQQTASILGTANSAGTYCVRAYDPDGGLERQVSYEIQVTHP